MKRKFLSIIIILTVLCTVVTTPVLAENTKSAGQPSSWAEESVNTAIAEGFVPQDLQSSYAQPLTRAEFCALVVAFYETVIGGEISGRVEFIDTTDINVEKAASIGVALGTGDNKFAPGANLDREQAAVMLSRLADAIEKPLPDAYIFETFSDYDEIAQWAWPAVSGVNIAGIMQGVGGGAFAPLTLCTREQCIVASRIMSTAGAIMKSLFPAISSQLAMTPPKWFGRSAMTAYTSTGSGKTLTSPWTVRQYPERAVFIW